MGYGFGFVAVGRVGHPRVEIVQFDAECLATLEVVEEGVVGLRGARWVCVSQVDEVRAVRDDVGVGTVVVVLAVGVEAVCLRGLKRWVGPFALRFEE